MLNFSFAHSMYSTGSRGDLLTHSLTHSFTHSLTHTKSVYWLITIYFFDVHVTVDRDKFLIIKPTRCTNFSNLFLEWNLTCIGRFPCPSSGVLHCTYSNGICHTCLLTVCEQDPARKLSENLYSTYCCFMYSEEVLMMDRGTVWKI